MNGKSIYLRFVLYMTTIVSIVVLIGCSVYYISIRSHITGELINNNARMDKQIASTYELFLDTTIKAAMVSIGDSDGTAADAEDGAGTAPADGRSRAESEKRLVYERLNRIAKISDFIHSVYYFTGNHVYVSMGFQFDLNDFYDREWMASLDRSDDLAVLPVRKLPTLPSGDKEVIPIVMNFPLHALERTQTYVLHVDANQLFRFLVRNQDVYEGFRFRIVDPSGMIFVSSDAEEELFRQLQDDAGFDARRVLEEEESDFIATRDGKKVIVSSYTSPAYGWKYVSESDYDQLSRSMLGPLKMILAIAALSLTVSLLAAATMSRRLYRPVRDIVRLLGPNEPADEPGHRGDEYALIAEHIRRFLSENRKLRETVDRNRLSLKRQFLYDLLVRNAYREQEIAEKLDYFGQKLQPNYTVAVFGVEDAEGYASRFSLSDRILWEFAMENIVMEIVEQEGDGFFLGLETAKFAVAISIAGDAPSLAETERRAAELVYAMKAAIRKYLKIPVCAGVGLARESPAQLHKSFREAMAAFSYADTAATQEVVTYRELHGSAVQPEYPVELEEQLLRAMMQGNRDEAVSRLNEMFDAMKDQRTANPGEQLWLSFQLLHALARKLMELSIPETEALFDGLTFSAVCQAVLQAKNDKRRLELLTRWTEWFCGYIGERREHASNEHVRQMLAYIREHYREPISVDGIAERIGLNRVYVGRLFKQYVNQNMADYINQVRVEKAVELMHGMDLKVMEIAEAVGFNNTHYFIKIFKKLMNVTPGKFMEQLAERRRSGT